MSWPDWDHLSLAMIILPPLPQGLVSQADFLTDQEQEQLWEAALLMSESRGGLVRLAEMFSRQVETARTMVSTVGGRIVGSPWSGLEQKIQDTIEDVLWRSYRYATFGLEKAPASLRPSHPRKNRFHRAITTVSGMVSGFVGLPGILVDIPFTTATILRSIAEVARDSGEDLADEDTRRACLEVLAFGGPISDDEQPEAGYWAARVGGSHLTINLLVRSAAGQFGMVLSQKLMTQAIPVAGAVGGGLLNYSFTDYYQSMAKVHFYLRALERRTGDPEAVQRCFTAMLEAARDRRKIKRNRRPVPPVLLSR